MNIAPTPAHAPASVRSRGRQAVVRALVLGCAMACASLPALAGQDRERDGRTPQPQQQPPVQPNRDVPPPRTERAPPPPPRVDLRPGDEQHRQAQQQDQSRRAGRLTPDERAELRRQINEAGVELYPNTPRR